MTGVPSVRYNHTHTDARRDFFMTSYFAQLDKLAILISGMILPLILVAIIISSRRRCEPIMETLMKRC